MYIVSKHELIWSSLFRADLDRTFSEVWQKKVTVLDMKLQVKTKIIMQLII